MPLAASFFKNLMIVIAVVESSPEVGSSKKSKEGLVMSS
jgi:hypothetical protein